MPKSRTKSADSLFAVAKRAAMVGVEFFLPRICHVCLDRLGPDDEIICDRCRRELAPVAAPVCPVCGLGRAELQEKGARKCRGCPRPLYFDSARGACRFSDCSRDIIHELKFYGHRELAQVMARRCYRVIADQWAFEAPDAIVPVPLHASRRRQRGFNQAEDIGVELERLGVAALWPDALERVRPTPAQSSLTPRERKANVKGAFYCDPRCGIEGKTALLVDDVMTTSSTVNECARMLKQAGAARVLVLVFARAGSGASGA